MKGLFGTIFLVIIFPIVCFFVIVASFLVALTAALWMPFLTMAVQVTNAVVYDLDSPEKQRNRFFVLAEALVWNIGIQGCLQPAVAIVVAGIVCPAVSVVIFTGKLKKSF